MTREATRTAGTEPVTDFPAEVEPVLVEAVDGPSAGAKCALTSGTLKIGSGKECDLVLHDRAVSRYHVTVELLAGAVRVSDVGSRNGTRYLGARIESARVPLGGSISLGRSTVRFVPARLPLELSAREELHGLLGKSVPMRRLYSVIERVAAKDSTVLVLGESGSGKELVARAVHALSPRAAAPFVVFDCASVSRELVESELFGHALGAFTGADRAHEGTVEAAASGTLLLDNVGALPLELQPKLLRLLEAKEFRPVGDANVRRASARIIATGLQSLEAEVRAGRFREDLYFRLAVAVVQVPALRERAEDIPLLAAHFGRKLSGSEVTFAGATLAAMQCDSWPGNVRELRNAVERLVALGTHEQPSEATSGQASFRQVRERFLIEFERDYLSTLLSRHKGNASAAAREAGLVRSAFYRLLTRHGLVGRART